MKQNESYSEYAYRVLRERIMKFEMVPGTPINEMEIANALSISRMPVHEAVTRLRDENLVEIQPRKESRVTKIDLVRVNDGVFIRSCVEPELILVTQGNLSAPIMHALLKNMNEQKRILAEGNKFNEFNTVDDEFHELLYEAANRSNTYSSIRKMVTHLDRMRYLVRRDFSFEQIDSSSYAEHREIFGAVAYRTPLSTPADVLVRKHITRFQVYMDDIMEKYSDYFIID